MASTNVIFLGYWCFKMYHEVMLVFRKSLPRVYTVLCLCGSQTRFQKIVEQDQLDEYNEVMRDEYMTQVRMVKELYVKRKIKVNPIKIEKYKTYTEKEIIRRIFQDKLSHKEEQLVNAKLKRAGRITKDHKQQNIVEKIKVKKGIMHKVFESAKEEIEELTFDQRSDLKNEYSARPLSAENFKGKQVDVKARTQSAFGKKKDHKKLGSSDQTQSNSQHQSLQQDSGSANSNSGGDKSSRRELMNQIEEQDEINVTMNESIEDSGNSDTSRRLTQDDHEDNNERKTKLETKIEKTLVEAKQNHAQAFEAVEILQAKRHAKPLKRKKEIKDRVLRKANMDQDLLKVDDFEENQESVIKEEIQENVIGEEIAVESEGNDSDWSYHKALPEDPDHHFEQTHDLKVPDTVQSPVANESQNLMNSQNQSSSQNQAIDQNSMESMLAKILKNNMARRLEDKKKQDKTWKL